MKIREKKRKIREKINMKKDTGTHGHFPVVKVAGAFWGLEGDFSGSHWGGGGGKRPDKLTEKGNFLRHLLPPV